MSEPTFPARGVTLQAWPGATTDCDNFDAYRHGDLQSIDGVTALYICAPQDFDEAQRLVYINEDFSSVMHALALPRVSGSYRQPCPLIGMGSDLSFAVIAETAEDQYLVKLPTGPCGMPLDSIQEALASAGINVHYPFEPSHPAYD